MTVHLFLSLLCVCARTHKRLYKCKFVSVCARTHIQAYVRMELMTDEHTDHSLNELSSAHHNNIR